MKYRKPHYKDRILMIILMLFINMAFLSDLLSQVTLLNSICLGLFLFLLLIFIIIHIIEIYKTKNNLYINNYFKDKFFTIKLISIYIIASIILIISHYNLMLLYIFLGILIVIYVLNIIALMQLKKLTNISIKIYIWGILIPLIGYILILMKEYKKWNSDPKNRVPDQNNKRDILKQAFIDGILTTKEYKEKLGNIGYKNNQ